MLRHYLAVTSPRFTVVLSLLQLLKDDIQKELAPVYFKLSNVHKISRLRWLVPVFHARATSDLLRARTHPRGKQNKYGDGLLCSRKVISPTLRRNFCLPETVSPRKFLVISKYGRKVLPELNARVLGTSSHWCCDRSCLDRGPRKYKHVQGVSQ